MKNIKHITLAALRNEDQSSFDSAIKNAVEKAVLHLGKEAVILALCSQTRLPEKERLAA